MRTSEAFISDLSDSLDESEHWCRGALSFDVWLAWAEVLEEADRELEEMELWIEGNMDER